MKYVPLIDRFYADLDNERVDEDIVGLSKDDFLRNFSGNIVDISNIVFINLFMDIIDTAGKKSYIVSGGQLIRNPYEFKPYKWCCKLDQEIEYIGDYVKRHQSK